MLCVPGVIFLFCHVAEQEVTLVHVARVLPSTVMLSDAMPLAELAETAMLALPLIVAPFIGELIAMVGGAGGVAPEADGVPVLEVEGVPVLEVEGVPVPEVEGVPVLEVDGVPVLEVEGVPVLEVEGVPVLEVEEVAELMPNPARM